ncbi:MAG: TetR/AcrR family transcriptional regulator [Acetobacteraceae bacterium]
MGRTRAFDTGEVLDRAMALFWRQGYEATSIQDLVEATRVNRASLYATFGGKHELFLAVLDHYVSAINGERVALLSRAGSPLAAIQSFFAASIAEAGADKRNLGCLITNTLTEMAPSDPAIRAKLAASLRRVEQAFADTLRRAQEAGEVPLSKDPAALARFLVGVAQGLRVLARSGAPVSVLRDIQSVSLSALL